MHINNYLESCHHFMPNICSNQNYSRQNKTLFIFKCSLLYYYYLNTYKYGKRFVSYIDLTPLFVETVGPKNLYIDGRASGVVT